VRSFVYEERRISRAHREYLANSRCCTSARTGGDDQRVTTRRRTPIATGRGRSLRTASSLAIVGRRTTERGHAGIRSRRPGMVSLRESVLSRARVGDSGLPYLRCVAWGCRRTSRQPTSNARRRDTSTDALIRRSDGVHHDAAPVLAAQALLARGMDDDTVQAYVQRTWKLDPLDARAAVSAAHVIAAANERPQS
jgi:hypothetical protein